MKKLIIIPLSIAVLFASGCSTSSESKPAAEAPEKAAAPESASVAKGGKTALEGSWHGREVTPGREGPATLSASGQLMEFHGAEPDDWIKGTFALRENVSPKQCVAVVTDSSSQDAVGDKSYSIFKIEDGTLTIEAHELNDLRFPTAFDAAECRQFVFKHEP